MLLDFINQYCDILSSCVNYHSLEIKFVLSSLFETFMSHLVLRPLIFVLTYVSSFMGLHFFFSWYLKIGDYRPLLQSATLLQINQFIS